jgi:HSP20 family protein
MKLLSKWRKGDGNGGRALATRRDSGAPGFKGLGRFRDEVDNVFGRVWRDFDRFDRDPWSAMTRWHDWSSDFGRLGELANMNWPAIDMAEDEKAVTLRVDVPGLDEKDLDVSLSGGTLVISGSRADEWEDKGKGVFRRERVSGSFSRGVQLPSYVDPDKLEARYEKGTLTLTVPKVPGKGPRRVRVTA